MANKLPKANKVTVSTTEDQLETVVLSGTDRDGSIKSYSIVTLPSDGVLYLDAAHTQAASSGVAYTTNTFYFLPNADFSGTTSFTYTVTDNQGAVSSPVSAKLKVSSVNDAPVLDLNGASAGTSAVADYLVNGPAALIAPAATVADIDSANFGGGTLRIAVAAATTSDRLSIFTDATVSLSKGNVFVSGVKVGTVLAGHTGSNGTDITINLSKGATPDVVSVLLDHIAYANSSANPASLTRTVQFSIVDNDGIEHGGADTGSAVATINIVVPNHAPTGSVTVSGTPTEDQTLTASNTLNDADGLGSITYHWLRGGVDTGVTASTYILGDADVDAEISVRADYIDGHGTAEAVTSAATAAVANVNDAPTGSVIITGTPTEGQTLTASNTLNDADGLGSITYHWLRGGVDTGATGLTYLLGDADVEAEISVRAEYIDGHGTPETVTSAATTTVLPEGLLLLDGHYYRIICDPFISQADAEAAALASSFTVGLTTWRGHLANVTSLSEENLIENQILTENGGVYFSTLSSGFWLGGEFNGAEWVWKYGTESSEAITYTDWGGVESAQGPAEPYLVLNMFARPDINGVWYSYDAGDTDLIKGYVIEYVPNSVPVGNPTVTAEITSIASPQPLSELDITNPATQFWYPENGHIYEFVNSPTLWQTAVASSQSSTLSGVSGYLATVTSAGEQAFLESHFPANMWLSWLGATDLANEGQWVWQTGPETGQALTYTNWDDAVASGAYGPQPDGGTGENYLAMGGATVSSYYGVDTAFKWVDGPSISEGQGVGYIIEYSGAVETTPIQAVTLTANLSSISDADGLGSFNFQWQSSQDGDSWNDVAGATSASYQSMATELAPFYRLEATFIDGAGLLEVVHSQSYASTDWLM